MLTPPRSAQRARLRVGTDGANHRGSDADLRVRLRERALDARVPQYVVLRDDHVRAHLRRRAGLLRMAHLPALALARARRRHGGFHHPGVCRHAKGVV